MVMAADQSLTFLNKWQSQQGMCHIVETLSRLGPPKVTEETQPDLTTALQVAYLGEFRSIVLNQFYSSEN